MATNRVELIWDRECPNVEAARGVVREALRQVGSVERWTEWRIGNDDVPAHARGFGSPTILVDGKDVTGHPGGDSDDCCRVYLHSDGMAGVPTVQEVAARLKKPVPPDPRSNRKTGFVAVGAIVAAVVSSACCWLPLLLVGVGVSVGGVSALFEAYRPWFLGGTAVLLAAAFWFAYRPVKACAPDGTCTTPDHNARRWSRLGVWIATAFAVGFASFPVWMDAAAGGRAEAAAGSAGQVEHHYAVEGMTCRGCARLLEDELRKVSGVTAATVSYEDKTAVVVVEQGKVVNDEAVNFAASEVGFTLRPR